VEMFERDQDLKVAGTDCMLVAAVDSIAVVGQVDMRL